MKATRRRAGDPSSQPSACLMSNVRRTHASRYASRYPIPPRYIIDDTGGLLPTARVSSQCHKVLAGPLRPHPIFIQYQAEMFLVTTISTRGRRPHIFHNPVTPCVPMIADVHPVACVSHCTRVCTPLSRCRALHTVTYHDSESKAPDIQSTYDTDG
jgi:hypothetical protein